MDSNAFSSNKIGTHFNFYRDILGVFAQPGKTVDGCLAHFFFRDIYAGAVVSWMQGDLGLIDDPRETEELARRANPADTTILVPAFGGLGAPYWRPEARALLYGMGRTTGRAEIVKAGLESVAYQIADVLCAMAEDSGQTIEELRVDGGVTRNGYLMEFQSGICDVDVCVANNEELSAIGAGYLAGIAADVYDEEKVFDVISHRRYHGRMTQEARSRKKRAWRCALEKA